MEPPSSILDDYLSRSITLLLLLILYAIIKGVCFSLEITKKSPINDYSQRDDRRARRISSILPVSSGFTEVMGFLSLTIKLLLIYLLFSLLSNPYIAGIVAGMLIFSAGEVSIAICKGREKIFLERSSLLLSTLYRLLFPVTIIIIKFKSILSKGQEERDARSFEDFADEGSVSDSIDADEKRLLKSIVELSGTCVSEIMRPRVEVSALNTSLTSSEVIERAIECGYSRLPVYESNLDRVKGFLYVKDLVGYIKDNIQDYDWHKLIRKAYFVPGSKKINDLLEEFRQMKIHLAVVVDEYGGTDGIVTLEDVLEEIVGEISDESDRVELNIKGENS